jgi:hypothetical protein
MAEMIGKAPSVATESALDGLGCSDCWRQTLQAQQPSLRASARWLTRALSMHPPPAPDRQTRLVVCRAVPACDAVGCESPIRRDLEIRPVVTRLVQESFLPGVYCDAELQAALLTAALAVAGERIPIPNGIHLSLGPVAFHAAVVANNLLCAAQSAPKGASNPGTGNPEAASADSLKAIERFLFPPEGHTPQVAEPVDTLDSVRTFAPTGTDLLVVEAFHRAVSRLVKYADGYRKPLPVLERKQHWKLAAGLGLAGVMALVLGLAAGDPRLNWIGGALVVAAFFAALGWMSPTQPEIQEWALDLQAALRKSSFQKVQERLAQCDVMSNVTRHFVGSPLTHPARAARFFKELHAMPDAALVMPRLVHDLASCPPVAGVGSTDSRSLWLAALGEQLLDDDGGNAGADIASAILSEVIASALHGGSGGELEPAAHGEASPLWQLLASEGTLAAPQANAEGKQGVSSVQASFPRFLVRLSRRAASLRANRCSWSPAEGRIIERVTEAVRVIWNRPPSVYSDWHRLLLRSLAVFLGSDASANQLPVGAGCSLIELCRIADEIRVARERQDLGPGDPLRADFERVFSLPLFQALVMRVTAVKPAAKPEEAHPPGALDEYLLRVRRQMPPRDSGRPGGAPPHRPPAGSGPGLATGDVGIPRSRKPPSDGSLPPPPRPISRRRKWRNR